MPGADELRAEATEPRSDGATEGAAKLLVTGRIVWRGSRTNWRVRVNYKPNRKVDLMVPPAGVDDTIVRGQLYLTGEAAATVRRSIAQAEQAYAEARRLG